MDLKTEEEKLNVLRIANEKAQSNYLNDLERDLNRRDGSARQDALHERFLAESRDNAHEAKVALESQEKVVSNLLALNNE